MIDYEKVRPMVPSAGTISPHNLLKSKQDLMSRHMLTHRLPEGGRISRFQSQIYGALNLVGVGNNRIGKVRS